MSTPPVSVLQQLKLTQNQMTALQPFDANTQFGVVSIEVVNWAAGDSGLTKIWLVPSGFSEPSDDHRYIPALLKNQYASQEKMGISVSAGDRFFVQTEGTDVVVTVNGSVHLKG